jgi:hypothetical protein
MNSVVKSLISLLPLGKPFFALLFYPPIFFLLYALVLWHLPSISFTPLRGAIFVWSGIF